MCSRSLPARRRCDQCADGRGCARTARRRSADAGLHLAICRRRRILRRSGGDARDFYDLTGRVVIATLRSECRRRSRGRSGLDDTTSPCGSVHRDAARADGGDASTAQRVSASNPHQLLVLMVFASHSDDADRLSSSCATSCARSRGWPRRRRNSGKGRPCPTAPAGATEVRAAGAAFLDMRNRIERQIEQRTLMLSGVSHDLRTPLTRLRLGLSMLDETGRGRARWSATSTRCSA